MFNYKKKNIICSLFKLCAQEGYYYLETRCPCCPAYLYVYYSEEDDFVLHPTCPACSKTFHIIWDPDIYDYYTWT